MGNIKDILFYKIFESEELDFVLAPINIILIAAVIVGTVILIRLSRKYLNRINNFSSKIKIGRKNDTLLRLFRQLFYMVALALIFQSFSVNNDHIHFESFLRFQFFQIDNFSLKVYNILLLIIMFFVTRLIVDLFKLYLQRNLAKKDWIDEGREYTILQLVRYVVYTIAIIVLIRSTGLSISLIIAAAGAFFVALGLGLQRIFSDYVSGFILLFDGSVRVGDIVEYDGSPVKVVKINIRTSHVQTVDSSLLVIPNSMLTTEVVESRNKFQKSSRFTIRISVAYGSDTKLVESLLISACAEHPDVAKKHKPMVWLRDFGDSGLIIDLLFHTNKPFTVEKTKSDIRFEIDRLFREHNVSIPFPQRDVNLYQKP